MVDDKTSPAQLRAGPKHRSGRFATLTAQGANKQSQFGNDTIAG
jgi:hypothetical protein